MIRKLCLLFLFALFFKNAFGQNQQILFGFDQLPQTLMLNPGAEVDYDKHFGVPFLSNVFFQVGATNKDITYNNIVANADSDSDILRNIYNQNLSSSDYFKINQKIEVFNAGFRLKNTKYYLSFGMYQEIDGYAGYPKDVVNLFYQGDYNENGGIRYDQSNFDNINFIGELVGVYHVGISKKVNENLNIGARFKILSGSLNTNSVNNKGHYVLSDKALVHDYNHMFNQLNIKMNSSGLLNNEGNLIAESADAFKGLFFLNGNYGLGLDLGATYHASEHIIVTASLLDLDYIKYKNKVTGYKVAEDFEIQDDELFDPTFDSELSYWENILDLEDFPISNGNVVDIDILNNSYNFYRSPKLNTSVKYQIFRESNETFNSIYRDARFVTPINKLLVTEFGIQTYTAFRPGKADWAITAFFSRELTKYLNTKITYTYDQFSAKNIGLGFSTHIRDFNFYATADNLLALYKLKDSNYQSFQFGMNFIFN